MTWTSHGHHIPGTPTLEVEERPPVARCGGVGLCKTCTFQSVRVGWKPDSAVGKEVKVLYNTMVNKVDKANEIDAVKPNPETAPRPDEVVVTEYLTNLLEVKNREYEDLIRKDPVGDAVNVLMEIHSIHRMLSDLIRYGVDFEGRLQ